MSWNARRFKPETGTDRDVKACVRKNVRRLKEVIAFSGASERRVGILFQLTEYVPQPWWLKLFKERNVLEEKTIEKKVKPQVATWLLENGYEILDLSRSEQIKFRVSF